MVASHLGGAGSRPTTPLVRTPGSPNEGGWGSPARPQSVNPGSDLFVKAVLSKQFDVMKQEFRDVLQQQHDQLMERQEEFLSRMEAAHSKQHSDMVKRQDTSLTKMDDSHERNRQDLLDRQESLIKTLLASAATDKGPVNVINYLGPGGSGGFGGGGSIHDKAMSKREARKAQQAAAKSAAAPLRAAGNPGDQQIALPGEVPHELNVEGEGGGGGGGMFGGGGGGMFGGAGGAVGNLFRSAAGDEDDDGEAETAEEKAAKVKVEEGDAQKASINAFRGYLASSSDLEEEQYDVSIYYYQTGRARGLATNEYFTNTTLFIIAVNAVYMGVEMDNNTAPSLAEAPIPYQIGDHTFCAYFTTELLIRFFAFKKKRNCFKDFWFNFDTFLVGMMVFETWVLPMLQAMAGAGGGSGLPTGPLRLLRMARMARMGRLMRAMPELVTMIKGMVVAMRAMASTLLLLMIITYVFAIVMFLGLGDDPLSEISFGNLSICMWTLMMDGMFMDSAGSLLRDLLDRDMAHMVFVFMMYVLLAQLTVLNMLIGVLCEVVSAVAEAEQDEFAIRTLKQTVLALLLEIDEDGSGMIEEDELKQVLDNEKAVNILQSLGINVEHFYDCMLMHFDNTPQLSIRFVMKEILTHRGDRAITKSDMVDAHMSQEWTMRTKLKELETTVVGEVKSQFKKMKDGDFEEE